MKKHAFLVLAHKQPQLLARILQRLERPNHHFFIHVDLKYPNLKEYYSVCRNIQNIHFVSDNIEVYHAGISIVYAEILLLQEADKQKEKFDFYHLISGQDYPIRSNNQFDEFFEQTDHSFMYIDSKELQKELANNYKICANRFHFNNTEKWYSKIYEKFHLHYFSYLWYNRDHIDNYIGGWQWFSWNYTVKEYVMQYINKQPQYIEKYNHTSSPDEHIFTTLLAPHAQDLHIEIQNPLRYISWHPHRDVNTKYRPYDLTEEDLPWIINSKAFFCRKVDQYHSSLLLDRIDRQRENDFDINEHNNFV